MALIPAGDGGGEESRLTCFRCGNRAAGPCALCHVMICAADSCSIIIEEPGLPKTVLCLDCARLKPILAAKPVTAPILLLFGVALLCLMFIFGGRSLVAGLGYILGASLVILAGATALSRWQWRSRLAQARRRQE